MAKLTFLTWIAQQEHRTDSVGVLARDIRSEQKRVGRPMTALNDLIDLRSYCSHAPVSVGISRKVADAAFREWIASEKADERARGEIS